MGKLVVQALVDLCKCVQIQQQCTCKLRDWVASRWYMRNNRVVVKFVLQRYSIGWRINSPWQDAWYVSFTYMTGLISFNRRKWRWCVSGYSRRRGLLSGCRAP